MKHFSDYDYSLPVTFTAAVSIWNDDTLHTPGYDKIGIYNHDDMGTGGLLWFENLDDLKFFMIHVWPVIQFGEVLDMEEWKRWKELSDIHILPKENISDFIHYADNYWEGDIYIQWSGTLHDLETSDENIPQCIREWFHESEAPITTSQKKGFMEFIEKGFS